MDTNIDDIKKLVESFSILDEKFVNKQYKNKMEVEFNRKINYVFKFKKYHSFITKKNRCFFLPVLVDLENESFSYLNDNIFAKNWERINENYFQINYILPNEDAEDYIIIKNNLKILKILISIKYYKNIIIKNT